MVLSTVYFTIFETRIEIIGYRTIFRDKRFGRFWKTKVNYEEKYKECYLFRLLLQKTYKKHIFFASDDFKIGNFWIINQILTRSFWRVKLLQKLVTFGVTKTASDTPKKGGVVTNTTQILIENLVTP
jgi:hypothetical protein